MFLRPIGADEDDIPRPQRWGMALQIGDGDGMIRFGKG
jgi:hypothetical protein